MNVADLTAQALHPSAPVLRSHLRVAALVVHQAPAFQALLQVPAHLHSHPAALHFPAHHLVRVVFHPHHSHLLQNLPAAVAALVIQAQLHLRL